MCWHLPQTSQTFLLQQNPRSNTKSPISTPAGCSVPFLLNFCLNVFENLKVKGFGKPPPPNGNSGFQNVTVKHLGLGVLFKINEEKKGILCHGQLGD